MVTRRRILSRLLSASIAALVATLIASLAGCSGGTTFNVQNPPPPPQQNVAIAFQTPPASAIQINGTTTLTAVVTNDPGNGGIDWTVTCTNKGDCGQLSALHTASGVSTTYTPPPTLPGNSETITIVGFATDDHTQNVVAPITIAAFGSSLAGRYVLQVQGVDSTLEPYQFAGVIVLDGNGGISSGEQTANFFDQNENVSALVSKSDPITGGSYFLGADGRGTITINTADLDVGQNGVETFSLVFLSNAQALIAETDNSESGTGTMDLQASTITAPSGGYAFAVSGNDFISGIPSAVGGVLNIDSLGNISGQGSTTDQFLEGFPSVNARPSGTVSEPDALGAVTLNLTVPNFLSTTAFQFTGYIVDATHIKLIESDNPIGTGGVGATGGLAIGQGSATGSFTGFNGTYVFGMLGTDLAANVPSTLTSAGFFTAVDSGSGDGTISSGFTDTFLQSYSNPVTGTVGDQISASFTGTYSDTPPGTGRARAFFGNVLPHPGGGFHPEFIFYQTGSGNPALMIATANNDQATQMFVAAGIAYPQSSGPLTFNGSYGFSIAQQNGSETDGTGQMTASSSAKTLSGAVDVNSAFSPSFNNPLTGVFTAPAASGLFSGTLTSPVFDFSPFTADFYIIDPTHGFFIETDIVDPNNPSGVVSFGYYATRTSVCGGCQ